MDEQRWRPNAQLKRVRELRGWSQEDVAEKIGTTQKIVSRWERGESMPVPYYRQRLCKLFGKNAAELGFLDGRYSASEPVQLLSETRTFPSEQQTDAWLTLGIDHLIHLFDEGWSVEDILTALQTVLLGSQAMSRINRRHLLQVGAAAAISGITVPTGSHISAEDRVHLCEALGNSIAAGWQLFHRASNAQVLAIGQAQLSLVRQASQHLYPGMRPILYSSVFNLIGAAYHFQGRYNDAYKSHEQAYAAALEVVDVWNMAQSRAWQANGLREQQQYLEALQTIEAALRLVSQQRDADSIRLQSHLFASGAEMAALLHNDLLHQKYLDASQSMLAQLPYEYNDEFDHVSWHQYRGTCALILNQNDTATVELQRAIDSLPLQSMIRHIITLLPLIIAYAREENRDRCLESIKRAIVVLKIINSPTLNKQCVDYIQQEVVSLFRGDHEIQEFAYEAQRQLAPGTSRVNTA